MSDLTIGSKYRVSLSNGFDDDKNTDAERFGGKLVTLLKIVRFHRDGRSSEFDVYQCKFSKGMARTSPEHGWSFYRDELEPV